jgi:hypothetical protein
MELKRDPNYIKFLCEVEGDTNDDIYAYNQILDFTEKGNLGSDSGMEQLYHFRSISAHQGPLQKSDGD